MLTTSASQLFSSKFVKFLPVILLFLFLTAGSVAFSVHSQSNNEENGNPASPDNSPSPTPTPHTLVGSFYTTENGTNAKLLLNNKGTTLLEVSPTLYNLQGQVMQLPSVWVEPQNFRYINLQDWAAMGGDSFKSGSIKLFHVGKDLVLGAQIYLTDEQRSITYEEKLAEIGKFDSRRQEAVWQIPTAQTVTAIALSNTSDLPLTVTGQLAKPTNQTGAINTFQLAAHETRVMDLRSGFSDGNQFAGTGLVALSLTHNSANKDALLARAAVADPTRGYSNVVQFSNPAGGKSSEYQGVGFQIENVDNQQLTPVIVARNVGTTTTTITAQVPYTRTNGTRGTIALPSKQLAAGAIGSLDITAITQRVQQEQIKIASLEVSYTSAPGSVVVAAHTASADRNLVFRVPMWDPLAQRSPTGGYPWQIEGTSVTQTYIKNITDLEQDYIAFLVWENGGIYMIGRKKLAAYETVRIDVQKLRDEQIPDERGRTIPPSVSSGQLQWTLRRTDSLPEEDARANLALMGRSEQVDVAEKVVNNYACQNCCTGNFVSGYLEAAVVSQTYDDLEAGNSRVYFAVEESVTCYGYIYESTTTDAVYNATWASSNPNTATVSGGSVTGVNAGNVQISATWQRQLSYVNPCSGGGTTRPGESEEKECKKEETVLELEQSDLKEDGAGKEDEPSTDFAACGTCVSRHTPFTAYVSISIKPKITILKDGQPITSTEDMVVGQQVRLSASITGGTASSSQWSIPGTRIANYQEGVNGIVTELTNLNSSSVDFYWVDGENGRQVTYSVTVGGTQYSRTAVFNVARPTVNVSRSLGFVGVRLEDDTYWWLRFGEPTFPGISFIASSFSGPQGNRAFVQTAHSIRRFQVSSGGWCRSERQGLDGAFPYSTGNSTEDSPGSPLNNGDLSATANDDFKMFYMFKPTGVSGNTIWVPLKVVNWSWSGVAVPNGPTEWRLAKGATRNASAAEDTTSFPTWNSILSSGSTVIFFPENGGTHSCN